jgi:HlyD family secretion protein
VLDEESTYCTVPRMKRLALAPAHPADFAPDLLAIQAQPPARLPRALMYVVFALFAITLLWVVFGRLDIVASAEGKLVPLTYLKIVQPAEGGIVSEILVREGETVAKGQVLLRMDPKIATADLKTVESELALKRLTLRRIDAELAGTPFTARPGDPAELYAQIEAQYRARRQAQQDALAEERAVLRKAENDLVAAREVQAKLERVLPSYRQSAEAYRKLGRQGFAGNLLVEEKAREAIEKEQDLKAQSATVAALTAAIAQSEQRLAQLASNYKKDLLRERVETESQRQRLEQERDKQSHRASLLELKAPGPGIVKELATHTVGTVVSPGTVLMTLVPMDEPLQAEVFVRNEDAGFVHEGQRVKVKLAAYPFQKYGLVEGTVTHVGPDASDAIAAPRARSAAQSSAADGAGYRALVALDTQVLAEAREKLRLAAGMQVVAEINQGERTVLEYVLSPVQKTTIEAGRER